MQQQLVSLVDPARIGPISDLFFALGGGPFFESLYDLGLKMVVRVPNRGSVCFLNLIIHYVNGEKFGTG